MMQVARQCTKWSICGRPDFLVKLSLIRKHSNTPKLAVRTSSTVSHAAGRTGCPSRFRVLCRRDPKKIHKAFVKKCVKLYDCCTMCIGRSSVGELSWGAPVKISSTCVAASSKMQSTIVTMRPAVLRIATLIDSPKSLPHSLPKAGLEAIRSRRKRKITTGNQRPLKDSFKRTSHWFTQWKDQRPKWESFSFASFCSSNGEPAAVAPPFTSSKATNCLQYCKKRGSPRYPFAAFLTSASARSL